MRGPQISSWWRLKLGGGEGESSAMNLTWTRVREVRSVIVFESILQ